MTVWNTKRKATSWKGGRRDSGAVASPTSYPTNRTSEKPIMDKLQWTILVARYKNR